MEKQGHTSPGRIDELESLRGIAALCVVAFHARIWSAWLAGQPIIANGYLMVDLFFVLSGLVIYWNYADRVKNTDDILKFLVLRIGRLYPVHLTMLGVFIAIEFAKYWVSQRLGIASTNSAPFVQNSWAALLQQLLLVHAIGPTGNESTFNGPSWSISVEFWLYIVFILVVLAVRRHRGAVMLLMAMAAATMLASKSTYGFDSLLRGITGFFAGCGLAAWLLTGTTGSRLPSWLAWPAATALVVFLATKRDAALDLLTVPVVAALIAGLVANASQAPIFNRLLRHPALLWLGKISYSLYMTHALVIWVFSQVFRLLMRRPQTLVDGMLSPQLSGLESTIAIGMAILCSLALATLMHRYVEDPLRLRSRALAQTLGQTGVLSTSEPT